MAELSVEWIAYDDAGDREDVGSMGGWVVSYTHPVSGEKKELMLSKFERPVDNLRALYLALDAIRLNEARGLGEVFRQNYAALPAPSRRDPYEVLGVRPDAAAEIIDAAYRAAAKSAHPDHGGGNEKMAELNEAYEAVKR